MIVRTVSRPQHEEPWGSEIGMIKDRASKQGLERGPRLQSNPKLLHSLRHILRVGHYSRRTEEAYAYWIRRFVRFHAFRHPRELHEADVARFLSHLAVEGRVSAATQGQALSAVLFLYRHVLDRPLQGLGSAPRVRAPVRIPVV